MCGALRQRFAFPIGFACLCLLVCSAALYHRSLWIDELVTYDIARLPFYRPGFIGTKLPFTHSILGYTMQDPGPGPLMYLLDGMFARFARPMGGEYWLRLPGIIAGALSCALLFFGLQRRSGFYGACLGATVVALLPLLIEFYTGARGYGWLVLISIMQWLLVTSILLAARRLDLRTGVAFIVASLIGLLINPMHTLWTGCLVMAIVIWWLRGYISRGTKYNFRPLLLLIATTAAIHVLWLTTWFSAMKLSSAGTAVTVRANLNVSYIFHRMLEQTFILELLGINTVIALPLMFMRRPAAQFQGWLGCCTTLGSTLLLAALCSRFFAAPRYFYALILCSIISAGFLFQWLLVLLRLKRNRKVSRIALVGTQLVLLFILFVPALRRAATSVQDWWRAAEFLKANAQLEDIVLTGPNSEYEVYRLYAKAAGVAAQAPLLVEDSTRIQHKLDRVKGLDILLQNRRRAWFVTASPGSHRTPQYWQLIQQNFSPITQIPGQGVIHILRHDPGSEKK